VTAALQEPIPEVASTPLQPIDTGALSQPFAFAAGVGAPLVTGGVAS